MLFVFYHKILHEHCFQFLLGPLQLRRETEDNAYVKSWGDKQRALWYVMVVFVVVNWTVAIAILCIVCFAALTRELDDALNKR